MYVSFILVLGHLYLALLYPKTRHALSGITRGWVDEQWALQHHRKWARRPSRKTTPVASRMRAQALRGALERLRQDLDVGEHRHEARVAGPARDDVQMHVVLDAGAGDPAEVPAEVEAVRRVLRASARSPRRPRRWISSASSSVERPKSPMCRVGATSRWPDEYGNLFNRRAPLAAVHEQFPSGVAEDAVVRARPPAATYSRRQGAHSGFGIGKPNAALPWTGGSGGLALNATLPGVASVLDQGVIDVRKRLEASAADVAADAEGSLIHLRRRPPVSQPNRLRVRHPSAETAAACERGGHYNQRLKRKNASRPTNEVAMPAKITQNAQARVEAREPDVHPEEAGDQRQRAAGRPRRRSGSAARRSDGARSPTRSCRSSASTTSL